LGSLLWGGRNGRKKADYRNTKKKKKKTRGENWRNDVPVTWRTTGDKTPSKKTRGAKDMIKNNSL